MNIRFVPAAPTFTGDKERLEWAYARIKQLEEGATIFGVIAKIAGDVATVAVGKETAKLPIPPRMKLEVGNHVELSEPDPSRGRRLAIIQLADEPGHLGPIMQVRQIVGPNLAEVTSSHAEAVVAFTGKPPRPGDRVVLDDHGRVIVRNIGAGDSGRLVTRETGVTWDDIGGQDEAKQALREAIEMPYVHAELFDRFKVTRSKGVLLHGRPGNGKTMLGRAAATALAKIHERKGADSGFIYCKGPDLLSKWNGESEANIRAIFAQAAAHFESHGYPAIIFLDEAEALLMKRGLGGVNGIERTTVPMFLAEMDGLFATSAFMILATNRPDTLDPAVVREGRIDRKIEVKQPTAADVRAIAGAKLAGRWTAAKLGELLDRIVDRLFDERKYPLAIIRRHSGQDVRFTLRHVVSGAMVVGVVERATMRALRRAIEHPLKTVGGGDALVQLANPHMGIALEDIDAAVDEVYAEQKAIDITDAVEAFCIPFKRDFKSIDEVR